MQTNMKEVTVSIPQAVHQQLIGRNGRLIRAICAECNGVSVHFPPPGIKSDDVVIRGAAKDIESAKKQLSELAKEKVRLGSNYDYCTVVLYVVPVHSMHSVETTRHGTALLYSLSNMATACTTCICLLYSVILVHTVPHCCTVYCTCSVQSIHLYALQVL